MIINAKDLTQKMQIIVAQKISSLSNEKGSSLLSRDVDQVCKELQSGTTLAKIVNDDVVFTIAFEPTGHNGYVEVGMTCNLAQDYIRGKILFPEIVSHYRSYNGNGAHHLYLTTNDIRMVTIAHASGFERVPDIHTTFPTDVIAFCCAPCPTKKTGVQKFGDQIIHCPRFFNEFTPEMTGELTNLPCMIFVQYIS